MLDLFRNFKYFPSSLLCYISKGSDGPHTHKTKLYR